MQAAGLSKAAIDAFELNFSQLVQGVTGLVPDSDIDPVTSLPRLDDLSQDASTDLKVHEHS